MTLPQAMLLSWGRAVAGFILAGGHDRESHAAADPADAPQPATGERCHRILIIEDNEDAATTLRDYLELMGHEVLVAFSGPDGVTQAREFAPTVVLCDVGLPGMTGWEVARALRDEAAGASLHLIAVTGYGTDEDRRRSAEAGFEAHLTKPLDLEVLDQLLARFG